MTRRCLDVVIVEDTVLENDEEFTLQLATNDTTVVLNPLTTKVIINDNDGNIFACYTVSFLKKIIFFLQWSL